ncbi:MAG: serine/threonine-protein kinase [Polyangiales bacterium]
MATRSCPSCGRAYPDAVFFCGEDGTITVQDQSPKDFDPRLGTRIGGYIAVARVADGAMGRVFEGRHPETKARVAIKVLHGDVGRDRIAVERFKREYESAMELSHPHIVKVLEFGETSDGAPFLTMEYLEGAELGKVLGRGQLLAPARVVRILSQVALALEHAHSFGFIHRDLKPDNIFLCRTEEGDDVRVLDFGSVKLQLEMGAKLTAIGTTVGSPFYMSPEQAMGRADVDQRTDVFALGAILYEMLTDRVAFDAPNIAKILVKIMNDTPAPPSAINTRCSAALDAVVHKALRKNKEERFRSARDLVQAAIEGFGLQGTLEEWAHRPQAGIVKALADAPRPELKPTPLPPPPEESPRASASSGNGEPTSPKLRLARDDGSGHAVASGVHPRTLALVAVVLLIVALLFILLRR